MLKISWICCLIYLYKFAVIASGADDYLTLDNSNLQCGFFVPNGKSCEPRIFESTWDNSNVLCRVSYSSLISRIDYKSELHKELLRLNQVWINIRRRANFFINETSGTLFRAKGPEHWGFRWANSTLGRNDCVALDVEAGYLYSRNCSDVLPFVCGERIVPNSIMTKEGVHEKAWFCPENWHLIYSLSSRSRICVFLHKPVAAADTEEACKEKDARVATTREYDSLIKMPYFLPNTSENAEYWANKQGSGSCVSKRIPNGTFLEIPAETECFTPLPFVCVKELDKKDVNVWISPNPVKSYSSSSQCTSILDLFTCDVKKADRHVDRRNDTLTYQWYKDNLPISKRDYVLRMSYFAESMKKDPSVTDIAIRQGRYHCEVTIAGSPTSYSSPKLDFFYSDIATYIVDFSLTGSLYSKFHDLDFSNYDFKSRINELDNSIVFKFMIDIKSSYPSVLWDFQNISVFEDVVVAKILLYVYREQQADLQDVGFIKYLKTVLEKYANQTTTSVRSADVCFSHKTLGDTCDAVIKWSTSTQSSKIITEPMCLDKYKRLVPRKCQASNLQEAKWSSFNCSSCHSFQPKVQDIEFSCPHGFIKLRTKNLCYKIHYERKSWDEANKICSESSSYLLNDLFDVIDPKVTFWIAIRYSYGRIGRYQRYGPTTSRISFKDIIFDYRIPDLHCVAAVFEGGNYTLEFQNCTKNRSFVCIQNPFEAISSVKFSNTWNKLPHQENCYYFSQNSVHTWHSSKEECQNMIPKAVFFNQVHNLRNYRNLKMLMYQLYNVSKCNSASWWIDMEYNKQLFLQEALQDKYVDWNPYTNFDLVDPAYGALTLSNGEIQWTLEKNNSALRYVCEMEKCEDDRPTHAYIEDRSKVASSTSSEGVFDHQKNFLLRCIPSGWFFTNSIQWYKDNINLGISSDHLTFHDLSAANLDPGLKYQGYYSCSVDQVKPRRTVFSSKVLFKLPGFQTFVFVMQSKHPNYTEECRKFMLFESNDLKCIGDSLKSLLASFSYYHFLVKNITCNRFHTNITLHVHHREVKNKTSPNDDKELFYRMQHHINYNELAHLCHINVNSISIKSTEVCFEETTELSNISLTWPTTSIGEIAHPLELCLTGTGTLLNRKCMGDFNTGALWSPVSIVQCSGTKSTTTYDLYHLLQQDQTDGLKRSTTLASLTSSPEALLPADVQISSEILHNIAKQGFFLPEILNPVIQTINNLIDVPPEVLQEVANSTNNIMQSFEHIASAVNLDNEYIEASAPHLACGIYPIDNLNIPNCAFLTKWTQNLKTLYNVSVKDLNNNVKGSEAGIYLPASLVAQKMNASESVMYLIHQNINQVQNIDVVGAVIQASFQGIPVYDVYPPVEMFFKIHQRAKSSNWTSLKCVFWDQLLNDKHGGWSYKGCLSKRLSKDLVACSCNHLTSFTVILELNPTPILLVHRIALSYITLAGCSLSCFGLGVLILTFICFREWRKSVKIKAVFNFSACLMCFLILFMTGINRTSSKNVCFSIAIVLHYLLLSVFAWMLVSAFIMYLNLVKVLGTYIPCLIQKVMVFAYGFPAVIVSTVLIYKYNLYYQEKYCWLSQGAFYYAIAGPVLLMLVINFIFFGIILYSNTCGKPKSDYIRHNQDYKKMKLVRAKALFCVSILLGLSWIFGFLAIGQAKLVFQYLFALTTTLQGFVLFICFILLQKDVLHMWRKRLLPSSLSSEKPSVTYISGSTVSNKVHTISEFNYENLYNNSIFRPHSTHTPYG